MLTHSKKVLKKHIQKFSKVLTLSQTFMHMFVELFFLEKNTEILIIGIVSAKEISLEIDITQ